MRKAQRMGSATRLAMKQRLTRMTTSIIGPTFDHPVEEIHSGEDDEVEERPENTRVTRYRGEKHVPVFKLKMVKHQQLSELPNKNRTFQTINKSIINNHDIVENKIHFNLTLASLFRACEFNTSFKELALLKTL
jgi:hypothetical protein